MKYGQLHGLANLLSESKEEKVTQKNKEIFSKIAGDQSSNGTAEMQDNQ